MNIFSDVFMYGFASLFAVINPIGMSAVFLSMTKDMSRASQNKAAYRVAMYGTFLLLATFFIGPVLLRFFGISVASMQVAGGALVFFTAWSMFDSKPRISSEEQKEKEHREDVVFFPLTMPLTTGAGAMAVMIALATRLTNENIYGLEGVLASLSSVIVVMALVALCYRWSGVIFSRLGHTGTNVVSRVTAFLLLSIGVSIVWEGILGLIHSMPH
jgi:multiple antibiotic resistance protein